MSTPLADLGRRYVFNERLLSLVTQGFTPQDWERPPGPHGGNSAHWLLAHLVGTRRGLLRALGEGVGTEAWEASYGQGSKPVLAPGTPSPVTLLAEFGQQGQRLAERLARTDAAAAQRPFPHPMPDGGTTHADAAHFLYFHESYHLGQIGLLRRIGGKPGFI